VFGAAKMLSQSVEDPGELRKKVTSPGGTTEAAFKVLDEKGWAAILKEAVHAARVRAGELAESA
jgi:pyrroline-5-carboxylate reductase